MAEGKSQRGSRLASMASGAPLLAETGSTAAHVRYSRDFQLCTATVAGVMTGSLVSVIVQPFDVIRTRMQADAASQALKATYTTARSIVNLEGVRSALHMLALC